MLGFLLKSHYLSDDFPNVLTTGNFASFCVKNYKSLETVKALLGRTTLYGTFSAPRTTTTRRVLALPHPTNQLAISLIIANERNRIREVIESSKITLYKTSASAKAERAFSGVDFRSRTKREAEILAKYPVVMTADIANFFHTIYSHSLPWAVLGKQHVKDVREGSDKIAQQELDKHWTSQIDVAIQRGNSRETFGIPVGPDTSRIIAEILLSGVHKNNSFAEMVKNREGYRLVDDFFIGFEDEASARICQDALRRSLWEYNLHLNETKTRIIHSSTVFDGGWKYEVENFQLDNSSRSKQRDGIQRLLEITLRHCEERHDSQPAAFFCRRLLSLDIMFPNFPFVRDCFLRIARDFTVCLKFIAEFVTQYRDILADNESLQVINHWARQVLATHARRGHDLEIAWVLVICGVLAIPVSQEFIGLKDREVSPVVLAVLGLLSAEGLLAESWDEWTTAPPGTGSVANGRNWLPNYEAVHRGWTTNAKIIKEIKGDPLFSRLLKAKVTFLDNSDFQSQVKAFAGPKLSRPSRRIRTGVVDRARVRSARTTSIDKYD